MIYGLKFIGKTIISLSVQVNCLLKFGKFLYEKIPHMLIFLSIVIDRVILLLFALDGSSGNIFVTDLRIPHPAGVLLGGNGIASSGRVLVNAGLKFVGKSPKHPEYLARHAEKSVFKLGDCVVIGANAVLIGPLTICDNVIIGAGSVVTRDILLSGTYVGAPSKRIADAHCEEWFA
jgi:hypothetical protein